jgi:hypothetical protein
MVGANYCFQKSNNGGNFKENTIFEPLSRSIKKIKFQNIILEEF